MLSIALADRDELVMRRGESRLKASKSYFCLFMTMSITSDALLSGMWVVSEIEIA